MTFYEKVTLLKQKASITDDTLKSSNRELDIEKISKDPTFFTLRLGYSCNIRCIHCFTENNKSVEDLTGEEIKTTIDSIPKNALIIVTGGEPTVRSDLIELLKYMKNKGHLVQLETNGIRFHDSEYLKSLNPYVDMVYIPIHSHDPAIFDKITGVSGSWEKVMLGLKNLVESDIYITSITVINQLNYKTLLDTFDMIQSISPKQVMSLTFPHAIGAAHSTNIVPKYSEIKDYIQPVLKKYSPLMYAHYIPKCLLYPYQESVVYLEHKTRPGTDYINGKWQKTNYGVFEEGARIKSEVCKRCVFNNECTGIWREYGELYPDPDLVPITQFNS
jgi:wyosine [tRNA(Phe)-imidazoG37] synthetase (radical SAM superfamily)